MQRFRNSPTNYQPVDGSNLQQVVLEPTAGQVGVIDVWPGSDTNVKSDYSYQPEADMNTGLSGRISATSRRPGRVGRNPFVYILPGAESSVDKGGLRAYPVDYAGGGRNTGSPDAEVLRTATHGPWDPKDAEGNIPTGAKRPVNRTWWQRLLGHQDQTGERNELVLPQAGARNYDDGYVQTPAGIGNNTFIVPNIRQTFDTPAVTGVGTRPDGQPYVAKAGRPTEDPWFDPQEVTVANTRRTEVTDSPPFLPDRVRAGAADPHGARPSQVPTWIFQRKFDQGIAHHLSGMKGVVRTPIAGRPIATADESFSIASGHTGQTGYHVTTPAPGMSPSGPQPNTVRQVPAAWDADLNVIAAGAANSPRNRNLRRA